MVTGGFRGYARGDTCPLYRSTSGFGACGT